MMRTITLEEHYATPAFMEGPGRQLKAQAEAARSHPQVAAGYEKLIEQLCDLDEGRIAAMDAAGIDVQVLSLTFPGVEQLEAAEAVAFARETNDLLAEAVRRHPSRFAGFAALPTASPEAAADELERTIGEYGFKGALINGHTRGRYLDDSFFWPILERAEALGVPIYLHPTPPPPPGHRGTLHEQILGGAFDRYPNLQLMIGHMGEGLPFFMPRLEVALPVEVTKLERPVGSYLRENLHYTFSGFNWVQAFLDLVLQVGVERIMFSADHPYASMAQARAFLDKLPASPADKERIAHSNAERLLRL